MEVIDRKFKINAVSKKSGKKYTEKNSVLFLLKDKLLPDLIDKYYGLLVEHHADKYQLEGVRLLKERVLAWQRENISKVKLADVEPGKEEKNVCKPNKVRKEKYMG